ncbi:hypothetical protein Slin15195_G066780 [Septoria linicola]|uniref:Pali-domain-containing protein n=1 Tax=Septoria linicola TaxID=215465 RepID=A0A9Q9AQ22_9PEZI|nr:hypothetical protein Slin14017_G099480 [Septoria linicola]USW53359.1 hypothetical protein Slin15195_G066780 [Septoria linicola]
MKSGSALHFFGVFLLFVSSLLLLFVTISAPIINHLSLLEVDLGVIGDKNSPFSYSFGTFGYCCMNCGVRGVDRCTGRHIGYELSRLLSSVQGTPYEDISGGTSDALTRVMVLHPIACGVAFIAFLLSIGGGVAGSLAGALAASIALLLTVIVMATDFTLFGIVRHHVNDDDSSATAHFGDAIWLLVATFIFLFLGMCVVFFTCFAGRKEKKRKEARDKEIANTTPVAAPRKKKRFGVF